MASRTVVAMSGGVDSSVAAALAVSAGGETIGVTLKLMPRPPSGDGPPGCRVQGCCGSAEDIEDAGRVCRRLGIRHYVVDISDLFEGLVVAPFVRGYLSGATPNPCVDCNEKVKFGLLLRLARAWGAARLATGHYARAEGGRLFAALDASRDQSYFLYRLTSAGLGEVMFPLGRMTKAEVRSRARALGLPTADKPQSQDVCFAAKGRYRDLIRSRLAVPGAAVACAPGPVLDSAGNVLGTHGGLENYTIGQRKGLLPDWAGAWGRAPGRPGPPGRRPPLHVTGIVRGRNALVVGRAEETLSGALVAGDVSWVRGAGEVPPAGRLEVLARIRHRQPPAKAGVSGLEGGLVRVEFEAPQRAVAAGQSVVFYRGDEVLGGGVIREGLK